MKREDSVLIRFHSTGRRVRLSVSEFEDIKSASFSWLEGPEDHQKYKNPIKASRPDEPTLIFEKQTDAAKALGVSHQAIYQAIVTGSRVKGYKIEELPHDEI